jgi:hypothetical protein
LVEAEVLLRCRETARAEIEAARAEAAFWTEESRRAAELTESRLRDSALLLREVRRTERLAAMLRALGVGDDELVE